MFPISNWTELDVWRYIGAEDLELPPIYYAHEREVFERDGMLYAVSDYVDRTDDEASFTARPLPHGRRHDDHRRRALRRDDHRAGDRGIARHARLERGATRADDRTS